MTPAENALWLATLLATLAQSHFYGEVTVQIHKGEITIGRIHQTVKPEQKAYKDMTAAEYKMHKDFVLLMDKFLGDKNGEV